jgi:hypothetical protein
MQKLSIIYISIILILFFCGYYYFRLDDTYIFYKYAKNIAEGNGYVFNLGEKINATTSPLYTLVLAFIYLILKPFIGIDFTVVGNIISICSILWIFNSIKKLLNNDIQFYFFAMIFLSMPLLKFGFGMETFLNLALIIYAIYLYTKEKLFLSSIFIGLSVIARFDSALFAGVILLHYIYKERKLPYYQIIIGFLLFVLPWFIFSKLYFNMFLPTTIAAKLSQYELGLFGSGLIFITNSVRVIPGKYFTVLSLISIVLFSVFYHLKIKGFGLFPTGIKLILTWLVLLFISYAFVINAPPYQWYYIPFTIAVSILLSSVLTYKIKNSRLQNIIFTFLFLIAIISPIKNYLEGYNPKYLNFTYAVDWLNQNAKDDDLIAVDDIGIIGYNYKKGKLVDALGLINPEVATHLKKKDYNWFLNHFKPEFIVHEYPHLQKHLQGDSKDFWNNYKVINVYENRGEKIALYKRK